MKPTPEYCSHCGRAMDYIEADPESNYPARFACHGCAMTYYPDGDSLEVDGVACKSWNEAAKRAAEYVAREAAAEVKP